MNTGIDTPRRKPEACTTTTTTTIITKALSPKIGPQFEVDS